MKIRRGQGRKVTTSAPLSGLAVAALALVPHHAAAAPHVAGVTTAGGSDAPASVDAYRIKALVAAERHHQDAALPMYRVKSGDNLSTIAWDHCDHQADRWTGIYAASHLKGSANEIQPGEELTVSCTYDPSLLGKAVTPGPAHAVAAAVVTTGRGSDQDACTPHCAWGDGDNDGMDLDHSPFASSQVSTGTVTASAASPANLGGNISTSSGPGGSFGACVVARESGGNSQVMNSSGHYGLYQFSASTWQAYGGSAADFGHASVAEQERVFSNALAQGGESNWSPYDGC